MEGRTELKESVTRPAGLPHRERLFEAAPEEEMLYSLSADGKRKHIHPVVHRGPYWKIRRVLAYGLMVAFFALPWIQVGGKPALLFDLAARRSHVFGGTFYPTDNLILVAFGFGIIITVFFVGSTFGRMWCGYSCPQTVYLEFLFRPIEIFLEGTPVRQRKLNAAPWSPRKFGIKAAKWALWTVLALLMATTFVSYFVGWGPLLQMALTASVANKGVLGTVVFVTALILFDFGWFRDQMCTVACPYGRLQNVMADPDTILVAYDQKRGDPKVRVIDRLAAGIYGDCIDCHSCVNACPTGTDIRRGLQPECIGSAQCIDACDVVMARQQKPPGLIGYTSQREQSGGVRRFWRPRVIVYLVLMTVAWSTLAYLIATRADALVEFTRGGRETYRMLTTGEVANQQRLRITSQRPEVQKFSIEVVSPAGASLVLSESPIVVSPDKVVTVNAVTTVPAGVFTDGLATAKYRITSDRGFKKEVEFLLLGPYTDKEAR
jgi:cytochrome c oxidase accessory protein FixG